MPVLQELHPEGGVPVKIWTNDVDAASLAQLENVARLPFVFRHVAAMPDVHAGVGATIGSVIATKGAVIPSAVGVDIGCGMALMRTTLERARVREKTLGRIWLEITERIPVGFAQRDPQAVRTDLVRALEPGLQPILAKRPGLLDPMRTSDWRRQLGTLGGGNHFIELTADETGALWVMIHSGSRGAGNVLAAHFIAAAKEACAGAPLPDPALAWLNEGTSLFEDYLEAERWAGRYAEMNRRAMMDEVFEALRAVLPSAAPAGDLIDCRHNYVAREVHFGESVWVTRKGAINAAKGVLGIVPGSMGAQSFLVEGVGEPESFHSSAHGAGRRMGRRAAKVRFTTAELARQTEGVLCRRDAGVLDEIPAAYKRIDRVIANQSDLTRTLHVFRQLLCVKG